MLSSGVRIQKARKEFGNTDKYILDPAAPDIPGVLNGGTIETANYLRFLTLMRSAIGNDRSLSIALPASFWYLKPFPVKDISQVGS